MIINPRYLEDVQTLFNLLLYSNIIDYLNRDDKQASKEYLQYLITQLNLGQYYPLYLYLWADLVAEDGNSTRAEEYINNYKTNYNWYHFDFKPSKASILSKLENLDLDHYIQYPSNEVFLHLESQIIEIENDLNLIYNELKTKTEIISPDFKCLS